ncbi:MAG: PD40 domain-containing protein [Candidatus Hydrogenedentes bacterium]|nr:PD40 domain-containing protein [Candidatus Hydrogenedentota bacterium]
MRKATVSRCGFLALLLGLCGLCGCHSPGKNAEQAALVACFLPIDAVGIALAPVGLAAKAYERADGAQGAVFAPNGEHIAFAYRRGAHRRLYLVGADGSECRSVTSGSRFDFAPVFSPDGSMLAFCSKAGATGKPALFVADADGGGLRQLTAAGMSVWGPQFSPDGKRIVFIRTGKQATDTRCGALCVTNVDGTGFQQLTNDPMPDLLPSWRDDHNLIFWRAHWYGHSSPIASSDWHRFNLWSICDDGSEAKQLTNECYYRLEQASLSKDGVTLSFFGSNSCNDMHVLSLDSPSLTRKVIPRGDRYYSSGDGRRRYEYVDDPAFSNDGKFAAFALWGYISKERGLVGELHVVNMSSGDAVTVLELSGSRIIAPVFSNDGRRIVFCVDPKPNASRKVSQLWIVNRDGTEARQIQFTLPDSPKTPHKQSGEGIPQAGK